MILLPTMPASKRGSVNESAGPAAIASGADDSSSAARVGRALFAFCTAPVILRDPRFDQLPHQGGRQRLVRGKADGSLAGVIAFEVVLVGGDRVAAHRVEGAMARAGAHGHQRPATQPERGQPVADVLLSLRNCRLDGLAELLESGALVSAQGSEVLVDGRGFRFHGLYLRQTAFYLLCFSPVHG